MGSGELDDATHGIEPQALAPVQGGVLWKDRYEPVAMAGEGSQGHVYRAVDHQHNRVVALKVRPAGSADERDALLSEARILLELRPHEGVPLVRDDFFIDDRYVIVMDWIEGMNLGRVLDERGAPGLERDTVIAYLTQVASALDHLHGHDPPIVHGDVKPGNCVLTPEGRVVLVDFGVSYRGGESVPAGTRGYLAPEVAAGERPTPAADIFGLAATTFALLAGAAPDGSGVASTDAHPLVKSLRPGLAIDPARRPASAGELVRRLRSRHVPLPGWLRRAELAAFVGRGDELAQLRAAWDAVVGGSNAAFLIAGEPGIGKSTLITELVAAAHDGGALVLGGRCDEGLAVPYQPFVESLRWHVEHTADSSLAAALGRLPSELLRLLPELSSRLPELDAPLTSDPQTERWRLFEAVASWLHVATDEQPLLLILEDLHWAAPPTLQLLRHVVASADSGRVLLLATYRDTEVEESGPLDETIAELRRRGAIAIALTGLDMPSVEGLIRAAAGHELDDRGKRLAEIVHEATGGVPLFVAEILAHLVETGAIYIRDGRWTSDLVEEELALPDIARDVIRRRVSHLPHEVHDVLRVAAVLGLEIELGVLERAAAADDDVLDAVEQAAAAGIVHEVGPGTYRFGHALMRRAVYDEMSATRRRRLHGAVGAAIETEHAADLAAYHGALALHFRLAEGSGEKALRYALEAGDAALAQQAHADAIRLFVDALTLVPADDDVQRFDILIRVAEAQRRAADPAHRGTVLAAAELAERLGDGQRLTRAALVITRPTADMNVDRDGIALFERALALLDDGDSALRARALAALALKLINAEVDIHRRAGLSDEALAMARRVGDLPTLGYVLSARNNTIWFPDAVAGERLANLTEMREIANRLGDPHLAALSQAFAPSSHIQLGDAEAADASLAELDTLVAELGQPLFVWIALVQRAMRALGTGRLDEAATLIDQALVAGEAAGEPDAFFWYGAQLFELQWFLGRFEEMGGFIEPFVGSDVGTAAVSVLALAKVGAGDLARARELMAPALESGFADIPKDVTWLSVITIWAYIAAELDDADAARALTQLLLPFAGQVDSTATVDKGPIAYYLGLLSTTVGDWDDAEARFAAARSTCDRMGSSWGPRVRYGWAKLVARRNAGSERERAVELARDGLSLARAMAIPTDIATGEALVSELT